MQSAVADRRSLWSRVRGVVARRDLLRALTWREVQVRYKQAFLGMAWAVFMPFSLMLVFTLVRSKMAPDEETGVHYAVWSYCGLLPWTMTQVALKGATSSLVTNKNLLAKVYFPRELFPLAKIGAAAVDFCVGLTVLFGLMLYFDVAFTPGMLLLPVCLLLHVVMLFGLGLILSAANLFYRDVQYVFDVFILIWMFASPVFIDPKNQFVVAGIDVLKTLNPLHPVLTAYRDALLFGGFRDPAHVAWGAGYALFLLLVGLLVFSKWEPRFAERV